MMQLAIPGRGYILLLSLSGGRSLFLILFLVSSVGMCHLVLFVLLLVLGRFLLSDDFFLSGLNFLFLQRICQRKGKSAKER